MNNLPQGMIPDRDNEVYYDTERHQFYLVEWYAGDTPDCARRIYIKIKGK